jgi:endonuclease YncB( thermonuclease family)
MMRNALVVATSLIATAAVAQTVPTPTPLPNAHPKTTSVFDIPQRGVTFITGDTWVQSGQTIRLYGVQSCIRGTAFTNQAGRKTDCGEASLAYLAALARDTKPTCTALAQTGTPPVILAICAAHVGENTLDLGTILTTEGFGFAALAATGKAVYQPYLIAELTAKKEKRGLWAAPDFPHPHAIMSNALTTRQNPLK